MSISAIISSLDDQCKANGIAMQEAALEINAKMR